MRGYVEFEAALFHSYRRGDGPHLDFVGGPLHLETWQNLFGQSPRQHGVDRRVFDLFPRQSLARSSRKSAASCRVSDPEMMGGGVVEAGGVLAEGQPGRLQGAVHLPDSDPRCL